MEFRQRRANFFVVLPAALCLVNLFIPQLSYGFAKVGGHFIMAGFIGVLAAELGVLAIWSALGPGSFDLRFIKGYFLGLLPAVTAGLGFLIVEFEEGTRKVLVAMLLLSPLLLLCALMPVWLLRLLTRIHWADSSAEAAIPLAKQRQFDLRSMMVSTTIVAVALSGASVAFPTDSTGPEEPWGLVGIFCAMIAVASLFLCVPSVLIYCFAPTNRRFFIVLLYGVVLILVQFLLLVISSGLPAMQFQFGILLVWASFIMVSLSGIFLGQTAIDGLGYVLSSSPATPANEASADTVPVDPNQD